MISLVEFLFLEDINPLQVESILDTYPNIYYNTINEFYDFFKSRSVVLKKVSKNNAGSTLLERLKSFKQSYEYEVVRNFIDEQNKIKKLLTTNPSEITVIQNTLESVSRYNLDTFDYYIVRKLIDPTGSSNGVLPSEQLQILFDSLLESKNKLSLNESGSINFDKNLRDNFDRAITFENLYKNSGRYRLPILDERFYFKDFDYIIDRNFQSLPEAVSAELNLLDRLANVSDIDTFLTDLTKLTIENENSITGLTAKVQRLEKIIEVKQEEVQMYIDAQIEHEGFIDTLATETLQQDEELRQKDETINQLNETISTTLSELESSVANQINSINSALDSLSQNVSSQGASKNASQDSEIALLKTQIAALQATINSLRNSSSGGSTGGGTGMGGGTGTGGSIGGPTSATGSASTNTGDARGAGNPGGRII
jgi:ribosomal protein S18